MFVVTGIREIRWYWLLVSVLLWPLVIVFCFAVLLPSASRLALVTGGLVQPTLVFSAVLFVIVVLGVIGRLGALRAIDIGAAASRIPAAMAVTAGVWVALQVALILAAILSGGSAVFSDPGRWTVTVGLLAAQLFGNAFVEELMFRGFLLPQLYLKLGGRGDSTQWRPLWSAIVISQVAFALIHIPNLHRLETPGAGPIGQLAMIFALGVFFALLYVRTGNLFIGVGLHTLINDPTPLVRPVAQPEAIVFVLTLLVLALGPRIAPWSGGGHHSPRG